VSDRETARKRAREWVDKNRAHYQELQSKLEDPERLLALLYELYVYLEPILSITGDDEPHKAMFAIGQTKSGVEEVFREIAFYHDFRAKQKELELLVDDEEEQVRERSAHPDRSVEMAVT